MLADQRQFALKLDCERIRSILTVRMPVRLPPDLDAKVRTAAKHFWATRLAEGKRNEDGGMRNGEG
jgi:hypothetical protein